MTLQTFSIWIYTTDKYTEREFNASETCEDICLDLCKEFDITPAARLLFSLRLADSSIFLPLNRPVQAGHKYEFRIRFQMADYSILRLRDRKAYNYLFHQVKEDLINGRIPELEYPNHKEKVVGLGVTNMYIEMLENKVPADELAKNYKKYVPNKYIKKHSFVIKEKIAKELRHIKNLEHDSYYVKGTYLKSIDTYAPNYLVEKYTANVPYPDAGGLTRGLCRGELEFQPFHNERAGINIYYSALRQWKTICKIEDLYAIIIEHDFVKLELRNNPAGFRCHMQNRRELESFVSCIAGYYRLMVKWTVDLCTDLKTPSLERLLSLKCHGPIGSEFSYYKLQEQQNILGSYIIRQCDKMYNIFYIDIITHPSQPETFKIEYENNLYLLHYQDRIHSFKDLTELARKIVTKSVQKLRLGPSEHDKASHLLLCLPQSKMIVMQKLSAQNEQEMRQRRAQLLNPAKDFRTYNNDRRITENGIITQMRADWILPDNKKLEVTLKILNSEKHLPQFMRLAEKWSNLFSPELIKMYGFTLSAPHTLVIESIRMGSLSEFLQRTSSVSMGCLIDAAYTLARALHYLQENNLIHAKIRCSSLFVIKYVAPHTLIVRLGDPGFQESFTEEDIPWIPVEYHNNIEGAKHDFKAEVWAYATTLWEIMSRGRTPNVKEYYQCKRRLPRPKDCPLDIHEIMLDGWDPVPDRRFTPQMIFSKLINAKDTENHSYAMPSEPSQPNDNQSTSTDQTHLNSQGDVSYTSSDFEQHSIKSNSTFSDSFGYGDECVPMLETLSNTTSVSRQPTILANSSFSQVTEISALELDGETTTFKDTASVIELEDGCRVVFQGELGKGHYGVVYRGTYEDTDDNVMNVAIKRIANIQARKDFEREIKIMQKLDHPNIVRIIKDIIGPNNICIVMEFVQNLSLNIYLVSHRSLLKGADGNRLLLKFSKEIASGMDYLVSQKIIHRDLAARNILIDSKKSVKISDFGLAQVANADGYYLVQNLTRDIPVKWYAPETLLGNKYSYKSDVWSYGVTLFEMFSRGQSPDLTEKELSVQELLDRLNCGERLKRPFDCPESIYNSLIMPCWLQIPKERPSFSQLLVKINNFMSQFGEVI